MGELAVGPVDLAPPVKQQMLSDHKPDPYRKLRRKPGSYEANLSQPGVRPSTSAADR
jgi:hypothetical protein